MIIANGESDGRRLLLLGLSRENINRLQEDQPIRITRKSHGDGIPEGWEIAIFFGETELAMKERLEATGAVTSDTKIHFDPKLNPQNQTQTPNTPT